MARRCASRPWNGRSRRSQASMAELYCGTGLRVQTCATLGPRAPATPQERTDTAMAALAGQGSSAADRVRVAPVEGADTLFTPAFLAYLVRMHDAFTPRAHALRAERDRVLRRALEQGIMPGPAPESARAA